jgi:lysophospholipase L1-like esterase
MTHSPGSKPSVRVRVLFVAMMIVTCAVLFEVSSRVFYGVRPQAETRHSRGSRASHIDPYERTDPDNPRNWELVPGFSMTLAEMLDSKRAAGRVLAVDVLERQMRRLGYEPDSIVYPVNRHGFKGPELDESHSSFRILTLGDSCTAGSLFDEFTYPRTLERELRERGLDVEVVNGGVEGYAPANILMRIDDYKALEPELTTIYIGWNEVFRALREIPETEHRASSGLYSVRLVRDAYRQTLQDPADAALAQFRRPKRPDRGDPLLARIDRWEPVFLTEIEAIVDEMESVGSRVCVVTLPGLFVENLEPSDRALEMGHLPEGTDNPFVLARLTERYNDALRSLAERRGLMIVDLAMWSLEALEPRDEYFFDSVHLWEHGQSEIGRHLAGRLREEIPANQASAR